MIMSCPFKYKIATKVVYDDEPHAELLKEPYYSCELVWRGEMCEHFVCVGEKVCPLIKK
jgi:hypothetical protein